MVADTVYLQHFVEWREVVLYEQDNDKYSYVLSSVSLRGNYSFYARELQYLYMGTGVSYVGTGVSPQETTTRRQDAGGMTGTLRL